MNFGDINVECIAVLAWAGCLDCMDVMALNVLYIVAAG
jgi:hypothetical protein